MGLKHSFHKSHVTVVRFEAAAGGTKTVSNILLFLSLSSFSSFKPPVSTFSLGDIDTQPAHLKRYVIANTNWKEKTINLVRVVFRPGKKMWNWGKNRRRNPEAKEGCGPPMQQLLFGHSLLQDAPLNAWNLALPKSYMGTQKKMDTMYIEYGSCSFTIWIELDTKKSHPSKLSSDLLISKLVFLGHIGKRLIWSSRTHRLFKAWRPQ